MSRPNLALTLLAAALGLATLSSATGKTAATKPASASDQKSIDSALRAAPRAVAAHAAVVAPQPDGSMRTLRAGNNGFTCIADEPTTPGPDPMCMDASSLAWVGALMGHKTPPTGKVGLMYMLAGGTDASNTDPYAKQPSADNDWVKTGAHIMVVGSPEILAGHPAGTKPDTSVPYVMWAGTPYAHLMVPVKGS